jgi:hypothetical protein
MRNARHWPLQKASSAAAIFSAWLSFPLLDAAGIEPDPAVAFAGNRVIMRDDNQGCAAIAP